MADVALRPGGVLVGQVVDSQGSPQQNLAVSLWTGPQRLAETYTDGQGYFAFSGLPGGVYQVVTGQNRESFRAWAAITAPPNAREGLLVIHGIPLARGQGQRLAFWLSNPWVLGAAVATAIAVPVALASSGTPSSP